MVQTERGPTYLIERESLLTNLSANTLSSASQELVGHQAMEFVQELLRPFVSELGEVREELGAERARRQMVEERAAVLEAELEALREVRESPQTVEEEPEKRCPTLLRERLRRAYGGPGSVGCSVAELRLIGHLRSSAWKQSEKGLSNAPSVDLARISRAKWAKKGPAGWSRGLRYGYLRGFSDCFWKLSEKSHGRANLLAIRRLVAT
jgi:hypothetical protein